MFEHVTKARMYSYLTGIFCAMIIASNILGTKTFEFEFIMLSLRMDRGMDIKRFDELYYTDFVKRFKPILERLEKIGLITYDNRTVAVRPEKMYLLNSILVEFMETDDEYIDDEESIFAENSSISSK